MNSKKILLTLFGVTSSAVWGPQAWTAYQTSQEPEPVYPSAYEAGASGSTSAVDPTAALPQKPLEAKTTMANNGAPTQPAMTTPSAPQADAQSPTSAAPQVEQLLSILGNFGGSDSQGLSKLLQTTPSWIENSQAIESQPSDQSASKVNAQPAQPVQSEAERNQLATVQAYLADSPLSAIVTTDSGAWAMLGGRIIREGDILLPGQLSVRSIQGRHLVLNGPDGHIEVPLPAFTAAGQAPAASEPDLQDSAAPLELSASPAPDQS